MKSKRFSAAFTLVELVVTIFIIGILAGVTVVGIGSWRSRVAETEVKSDIANFWASMEEVRNRSSAYPVFSEGTEFDGTGESAEVFRQSEFVTITYSAGDEEAYCIDVQSKAVSSVFMFLDTSGGNETPLVGTCLGGAGASPASPDETVFVFDTTAPGCTGTVQLPISVPLTGGTVDWGDGSTQARSGSLMSHTYSSPGKYVVSYTGPLDQASYHSSVNTTNAKCLTRVNQWANNISPTRVNFYKASNLVYVAEPPHTVTNMSHLFNDADSFNQAIGNWDVSNVTNLAYAFSNTEIFNQPVDSWDTSNVTTIQSLLWNSKAFNQPINAWNVSKVTDMRSALGGCAFDQPLDHWDVSKVTDMETLFGGSSGCPKFNQPIGNWNVSNVTDMHSMFVGNYYFNQPIGDWDVSNVTDMSGMFQSAKAFNQPIGNWNTAKVTNMTGMFYETPFNQSIGSWNTANVTTMYGMFQYATAFNQSISGWNTSKVTNTQGMFYGATAFNQSINAWNMSNVTTMRDMFRSATSFNQPLNSWNTSKVTSMQDMFRSASSFNKNISGWNVTAVTNWSNFRVGSPLSSGNTPAKFL